MSNYIVHRSVEGNLQEKKSAGATAANIGHTQQNNICLIKNVINGFN